MLDQASSISAPTRRAPAPPTSTSGTATFARRDKIVRFERASRIQRGGQVIEADTARRASQRRREADRDASSCATNARITASKPRAGALQALSGREMNAEVRRRRRVAGARAHHRRRRRFRSPARAASRAGKSRRARSTSRSAPDGSTPTALAGRDRRAAHVSGGAGRRRAARSRPPRSTRRASRAAA